MWPGIYIVVLSEIHDDLLNKQRLSCAKLKFSLVTAVTEDETEDIVGVWYLSGWRRVGGWVGGGLYDNNAKSALTKVEVKV